MSRFPYLHRCRLCCHARLYTWSVIRLYYICNFCTIFYTSVIRTLALAQYEHALYLYLPTDVSNRYDKVV